MNDIVEFCSNPRLDRWLPYGEAQRRIQSLARGREAFAAIRQWDGYRPTPLVPLPELAANAGVAELRLKHEGHRFELGSFKALGGAYAVARIAARRGDPSSLVVTCATDGNHGRSVAWGARRAGARAVVYVHETVSAGRAAAIVGFGAEVRREGRTYDDSVRAADVAAKANGWTVVSDTSYPGYDEIPKDVMQGYAVMPIEVADTGYTPTHVFVQGGVGGLAAAVLAHAWETLGTARPVFVVVEPETAACLLASARAGRATAVGGDLDTIMAGLACGEPSLIAWDLLAPSADAFLSITDASAAAAMRLLAQEGLAVGESGVAGLAAALAVMGDPARRAALGLGEASRVLVYGTEGATDPAVYRTLTGRDPAAVEPPGRVV